MDVPATVRAAGSAHKEHARQALHTIVELLEVDEDELVEVDGSLPPTFGEWRLRGVKRAWFCGNGAHTQAGRGRLATPMENQPTNDHTRVHL